MSEFKDGEVFGIPAKSKFTLNVKKPY